MLQLNYAQWNEIIQGRSENCGGAGKHWIEFSNGFSQVFPVKLVCLRFNSFLCLLIWACGCTTALCIFLFSYFPFSSEFEVHSSMLGLKFEFVSPRKKYLYRPKRNICIAPKEIFVSPRKYLYRLKRNIWNALEEGKYFIDLHSWPRLAANLEIFA